MTTGFILLAFFLFFLVALLYSTIGHAGASGYLAIMAWLSFAPDSVKTISLVLNVFVAAIASYKFIQSGYFDKKIFLSLIITSIPAAYLGGSIHPNPFWFKLFAAMFLMLSAVLLLIKGFSKPAQIAAYQAPILPLLMITGAIIGFISGLIGVGGGIFLSPIIILFGWTDVKKAAGVSALFIFCNSLAGLVGHVDSLIHIDYTITWWTLAVILGGFIGAHMGTKKMNSKAILICLFLVLFSSGIKFLYTI